MEKLIRDKDPAIMESEGKTFSVRIASDEERLALLEAKLLEELNEYYESREKEELADILDMLQCVAVERGWSLEQLMEILTKKREERGGFYKGIVLKDAQNYSIGSP